MSGFDEDASRAESLQGESRWYRERGFVWGLVPVSLVHVGLLVWGLADPARVVMGDRAEGRLARARALVQADAKLDLVLGTGWPGDYGFHAVLIGLGGIPLALFVQFAALIGTLVLLYVVTRRLGVPEWAAATATSAYALLASNLHQPYTIVTEALFVPAVAGIVMVVQATLQGRSLNLLRAVALGGMAAAAVSLRAVYVPVLPAISVFLASKLRVRSARLVVANAVAFSPLIIWGFVQVSHGQPVRLGGEGFSLEHNLAGRMNRMSALGGDPIPAAFESEAGLADYLVYSVQNPMPFVRVAATDSLMLVLNPGVNHTYGVFLGLFEKSEGTHYWVPLIDEQGFAAALGELARRDGSRLFWNGLGMLLWGVFCLVAAVGVIAMLRGGNRDFAIALCLMVIVLAAGTFASHAIRWSQRSPMEFSLAIMFSVGLSPTAGFVAGVVGRWTKGRAA